MNIEHLPSAILTATLLLRLARLVRYRYLRALIRTGLLTAAVAAGALLLAASGHAINVGPSGEPCRCHCAKSRKET